MAQPLITVHVIISGKVQGVFYRDTARRKAQLDNISGWVKNRVDGQVEVMASGEKTVVDAFMSWLWKGSPASRVSEVKWEEVPFVSFEDFTIRR